VSHANRIIEPVPKDLVEAFVREMASFIPVLGDLFNLVEAVEAFRAGKADVGLIYLVQFLPGPPLPLSHIIAYALGKGGGFK